MKNLLAFTALLATGFLAGRRRARKVGPIDQYRIEVKADTKEALAALKELEAQVVQTDTVVGQFNLRTKDLIAAVRAQDYRGTSTD